MGLDMFLSKRTYVGNQYRKAEQQVKVVVPENQENVLFPIKGIKQERISTIIENVAYWRKANQIHKWFVDNVQGGEDDCDEYDVSKEKLKELLDKCLKILKVVKLKEGKVINGYTFKDGEQVPSYEDGKIVENPEEIEDILPIKRGFFFGGTQYDGWYVDQIKDTVEQLKPLLEEEGDFFYHSSW